MKILFFTLLDIDLNQKGIYTDLMHEFANNHHQVHIVSATEKVEFKDSVLKENNLTLSKVYIGQYQKTNVIKKGFTLFSIEYHFKQTIKKLCLMDKFDLIIYSTPPITFAKTVGYVKKAQRAQTYLLLKDIFPQNAVDLGILQKKGLRGLIYKYFRYKEKQLYKISDYIGCMSPFNVEYVLHHNKYLQNKIIEVCPNTMTIQNDLQLSHGSKVEIRKKHNLPEDQVLFIYGGNLGKPQGIPFIIDCLKAHEDNPQGHIVIVGSGTEYSKLKTYFEHFSPTNASLMGSLRKDVYEELVLACDVGLIFLDNRFTIPNFPSRLLSYMHALKPVLAATDKHTDLKNVIDDGEFGYWCQSTDFTPFIKLMERFKNEENRIRMGESARLYLENNYTSKHAYDVIMKHFEGKD